MYHGKNYFSLSKDLVPVGVSFKHDLGFSINRATIHILPVGPNEGLWIYERIENNLPSSLRDLDRLVMDLPLLLFILGVYDRVYVPSTSPNQPARR